MPIYEFYCSDCHALFSFFSSRVDTDAAPDCPSCSRRRIERRPARFAKPSSPDVTTEDEVLLEFDEQMLESAMHSLSAEFQGLKDQHDPQQMVHFFRRFGETTGMQLGPRMVDMLNRIEAGEDPDQITKDLEETGEKDDSLADWFRIQKGTHARKPRPRQDENLYFL